MCIRDRADAEAVGVDVSVGVGVLVCVDVDEAVRVGVDVAAVSYTHLRAHETVLDLVCRLLLEKKKIKKHSTHYEVET